jgi:asparagine synthase (glutamine-hydrolysing)
MCGIAGIIDYQSSSDHGPVVQKMATTMSHRGPDAAGFHHAGKAFLGHTRLSIIDLASCSNQPMADATGRYHSDLVARLTAEKKPGLHEM